MTVKRETANVKILYPGLIIKFVFKILQNVEAEICY